MVQPRQAVRELAALDRAVYDAVQATPSPSLDRGVARISRAADHSAIWLFVAAVMAVTGERPRRAALVGLAAVGASSALVNAGIKPLVRRDRPSGLQTVRTHVVRMPTSASYPSGHAASAFAFSSAVGSGMPGLDAVLRVAATTVAYSRVHTGVHYPGDVAIGALLGTVVAQLTTRAMDRHREASP